MSVLMKKCTYFWWKNLNVVQISPRNLTFRKIVPLTLCGNFMIFLSLIIGEINFWGSKSANSAIFTHWDVLNFDFYQFLHILKSVICQIDKVQRPKYSKNGSFWTSTLFKIDFTYNLSDRKIMKFSHCV